MSRAERELQLIEVAEKVFGEHGYQATTVDDVARQAGVTKPVIYDHFGSKEGLLSAVVRRLGDAITEVFTQAWAALPERAGPQDRIRAVVHAFYSLMDARPGPFQVWVSTASHFEIYPGVRDGVRQIATSAVDFETPAAEIETRPTCHIPICRLIAVAPISTARSRPALPR